LWQNPRVSMTITAASIPVTAPLKVDAATGLLVGAR
jgi:hypothetical protein